MDFTVEGKVFRACAVEARVLAVAPWQVLVQEQDIALGSGANLRMDRTGAPYHQCGTQERRAASTTKVVLNRPVPYRHFWAVKQQPGERP